MSDLRRPRAELSCSVAKLADSSHQIEAKTDEEFEEEVGTPYV
jgi:hypothetical protein